jgi:hypothetical protein
VALLSLCWTALMRSHNEQQQSKQATPVAATRRQHRTMPTHKAISTRIEAAAADNEDAASASVGASSVPAIPVIMLRACAKVLLPAIGEEMQLRELLFSRSSTLLVACPSSSTTNRKRGGAPAGLHGATELPFSLPLRRKLPPRSYPELCPFCQNFAFFSAIYAPSVSSFGAMAAAKKSDDNEEETHVFLLCCTACLVKFLRAREDELAAQTSNNNAGNKNASSAGGSSNKKRRINNGSSNASSLSSSSSSTRAGSSSSARRKPAATTWGEAGRLPNDEERLEQFVRSVGYSMHRHAGAWSRAYVGERCNNELLKTMLAFAQQIVGGAQTQQEGDNDNDDEESATSARASPFSSPSAASSKAASSSSFATAAPATAAAGLGATGIWARVSAMLHIGVVSDEDD